ncbi:MAG: O-antigen ligase family protein [Sphingomicrobium sp.]
MRPQRGPAFPASGARDEAPLPVAALLLMLVAVLLGGGHLHGPIRNGLIEVGSAALLIAQCWRQARRPFLPDSARAPLALFAAVLLLILGQMIPLPWTVGLAGRAMTDGLLALPGMPRAWHPLSLDPAATARFAASLLVPLAAALATIGAGQRGRIWLVRAIALLAAASAALGMVQLALGYPIWSSPFGMPDPGHADGLFVNRNHQAMLLLSGMLAAGLWIRLEGPRSGAALRLTVGRWRVHAAWLLMPLFALMTAAAGSRAGIGLLLVVLPGSIAMALGETRRGSRFASAHRLGPVLLAGVVLLVVLLALPSETIGQMRARFVFGSDARIDFLPDILLLCRQYWPWGSGFGTFVPAYAGIEDLDHMRVAYLNHAHNELLEWIIEGGLPATLLMTGAVGLFAARLWLVLSSTRSTSRKAMALTGGGILLLLAAHSAIDYPLRTDALAAVAGVAIGLLFTPALDPMRVAVPERAVPRWTVALGIPVLVGLLLGAQILRLRLAEVAAGDADGALAAALHSHDGMANAYAAEALLAGGNAAAARTQAIAAIGQSPLSIVAVRTLAAANQKLGDWPAARAAWRAAASMGWRDGPTQYWAMRQALADGEGEIAGQRADAVLRLNEGDGPFASLVRPALADARLRAGLLPRLALAPMWRTHFFFPGDPLSDADLAGLLPTLLAMQSSVAPPTRHEMWQTTQTLLARGRYRDAIALDRPFAARRRADPGSLIDDGGFDRPAQFYRDGSSPFDWHILGGGNANTADLDEAPPRAMTISVKGLNDSVALARWVELAPGRYALGFRMDGEPEAPSAIGITVACGMRRLGRSPTDNLAASGFQQRRLLFDVPLDCPVVMIGIGGFAAGTDADAAIDDIRLMRQ